MEIRTEEVRSITLASLGEEVEGRVKDEGIEMPIADAKTARKVIEILAEKIRGGNEASVPLIGIGNDEIANDEEDNKVCYRETPNKPTL